jgi:hypothetical protein
MPHTQEARSDAASGGQPWTILESTCTKTQAKSASGPKRGSSSSGRRGGHKRVDTTTKYVHSNREQTRAGLKARPGIPATIAVTDSKSADLK